MAGSAAFKPAPRSSDDVAVAHRADEPSASRPGPAGGLLRPSRVPVPGAAAALTGSLSPGDGRARHVRQLRPSGAPASPAVPLARPSTVPARPVRDLLPGPAVPLAAPLREEMQARLGADFSDVRVHTGAAARASAAGVGARAYTSGSHVVIGDGGADKHTLAHELTHVIQQRTGPVAGTGHGGGLRLSDPSDPFERAAESNAVRVMSGSASRPQAPPAAADAGRAASTLVSQLALQRKQYTEGSKQAPFQPSEAARSQAKWVIEKGFYNKVIAAGTTLGKYTWNLVKGASPGTLGYEKFMGKIFCGGRTYGNADKQLPGQTPYTEWDVVQYAAPRGPHRVVISANGKAYFTNNHYADFVQINSL